MDIPMLTDGTVVLREHRPTDSGAVLDQALDPMTQQWTQVPVPYTRADAEAWVAARRHGWESGEEYAFVVEALGRFAGQVGLRLDGQGAAEVGYGLSRWARGQGLMTRALRLALTWAFAEAGVEVVHWRAHVGNWGSRRVAWACGFTLEGRVRGLCAQRGERKNAWVGSLLPGDEMRPSTPWLDVPELRGPSLVLRRHHEGDALRIAQACAADSTQEWLPDLPAPYTIMDAAAYLAGREEQHAAGTGVYWAMADPDDDTILGALGLMGLGAGRSRTAEIGYWVHPDARGRGLALEAVGLAARHALLPDDVGGLGLDRALIRVAEDNAASRRVAEKAGFTEVGRDRRGERLRNGRRSDMVRYDLLADELPPA